MEITEVDKSIPPDPFIVSEDYRHFRSFREMRQFILNVDKSEEEAVLPDSFVQEFIETNPEYYEVYKILGDYFRRAGQPEKSIGYYRLVLGKEIPRQDEKNDIIGNLSTCLIMVKKSTK